MIKEPLCRCCEKINCSCGYKSYLDKTDIELETEIIGLQKILEYRTRYNLDNNSYKISPKEFSERFHGQDFDSKDTRTMKYDGIEILKNPIIHLDNYKITKDLASWEYHGSVVGPGYKLIIPGFVFSLGFRTNHENLDERFENLFKILNINVDFKITELPQKLVTL